MHSYTDTHTHTQYMCTNDMTVSCIVCDSIKTDTHYRLVQRHATLLTKGLEAILQNKLYKGVEVKHDTAHSNQSLDNDSPQSAL
jgi:hypothetical protein